MWTTWTPAPTRPTPWAPPLRGVRRLLIGLLLRVSALLVRAAVQLQRPRVVKPPQTLEFHAEAGAPEGALYVDGRLVGRLPGVTRL